MKIIRNRKQIRLKNYDYSKPVYYYITICTFNKEILFCNITDYKMKLNKYGEIAKQKWYDLPNHNSNIKLDSFVIMPNHIHGIINFIETNVGAGSQPAPDSIMISDTVQITCENVSDINGAGCEPAPTPIKKHGLPEIVRQFKTFSAKEINEMRNTTGTTIWQRNYYEHIIRNEKELWKIRQYIKYNPINWEKDEYN